MYHKGVGKLTKFGYARVSSKNQSLDIQIKQLKENGCEEIFKEKISGRNKDNREEFNLLLDKLGKGDSLTVTKMDRFARSTRDALNTIQQLNDKGVSLIVIDMGGDKVDTSTRNGKFMITMLSAVAEFEADMIRDRQIEGIAEAKKRGVYKGRPTTYSDKHKGLSHAIELYNNRDTNKMTVKQIEQITKISRATIYRAIEKQNN